MLKGTVNGMSRRIAIAIFVYLALALAASVAFGLSRQYLLSGHANRYVFIVFGPAVSMHTHMGLPLFLLQSALLVPLVVISVVSHRYRVPALLATLVGWGYIGWRMAVVFLDS